MDVGTIAINMQKHFDLLDGEPVRVVPAPPHATMPCWVVPLLRTEGRKYRRYCVVERWLQVVHADAE